MRHWTRRDFTRNLLIASMFSPFIAMLENKPAKAAAGKAKYLFVFHTPGTDPGAWAPGGGDSNIMFSAMTEPLSPLKANLILADQLNSFGSANNHASPGGLTGLNHGAPTHISLDQFVSDGLAKKGIVTQIPNLVLGGVPNEQPSSFYRMGRAIAPIASPSSAYQTVFSGGGAPTTPTPTPDPGMPAGPSPAEERIRRRKSILDLCRTELTALQQTLGTQEREKLQLHADSIRQLEMRLAQQQMPTDPGTGSGGGGGGGGVVKPVDCRPPGAPAAGAQHLQNSVLHMDVAINAFACDITRVASVQFGHHQSTQVTIEEVGTGDWHNTFKHSDPAPRTRLVNLEKWLCKQFVAAANKLKALPAPDGSGTLFDQTIMIWARDMGDAIVHAGDNMPFVLSGGAGGYLRFSGNGRYVKGGGAHHQRVLMNAIEAMGITDFTGFGDTKQDRTPLGGIATT